MPYEGETRISPTGVAEVYSPEGIWITAPTPEEIAKYPAPPGVEVPKETAVIGPGINEVEEEIAEFEKATEEKEVPEEGEPQPTAISSPGVGEVQVRDPETGETQNVKAIYSGFYTHKGWEVVSKGDPYDRGEIEELTDEDEEKSAEETEIEEIDKDLEAIDFRILDVENQISGVVSGIGDAESYEETSQIKAIRAEYENRRAKARELGDNQKKALHSFNIRRGTQRYAPETAAGIITGVEALIIKELNAIKSEEMMMVAEMKAAIRTEKYDAYMDLRDRLDEKRKLKVDKLKLLAKTIKEKNDEIEERNKQSKTLLDVMGAVRDLDTRDITEIVDYFQGKYTPEEIQDVLDITEIETEKEEYKTFDGIPYRAIKDVNGVITGYEKIPGIEKEEDVKWSGGKPYRAVRDEEGNILKYEEVPGIPEEVEKTQQYKAGLLADKADGMTYEEAMDNYSPYIDKKWIDESYGKVEEEEKYSEEYYKYLNDLWEQGYVLNKEGEVVKKEDATSEEQTSFWDTIKSILEFIT